MVSTATLAVVNLSLMMASKWSMAFLFFLGMIVFAAVKRRNRESCSTSLLASSGINHEVFLSFRGTDTRKGFTGFLHKGLENAGIEVFKDDKNLRGGEEIKQGLKDAIKRSRISIVIFSKDYASSKSCLMEMVKMWECRKSHGQIIIPIFYDVSPDEVKHQTGDFAASFERHQVNKVNPKTIKTCKKVLRKIVDLVGYERKEINGGYETDLVEKVVTRVRQVLKKDDQLVTEDLVGVDLHVQRMMTELGVVYSDGQAKKVCGQDRRVVAICGMPGVGKTTLAKVVFNKMHKLFDGCSFLEDINSKGVEDFQEMLIADLKKEKIEPLGSSDKGIKIISSQFSNMKVLIVLDDVHKNEQIEALAGKLSWFKAGSRIIVTTDNSNVLGVFDDVAKYTVKPMGNDHALELFRKHAFPVDAPPNVPEYDSLSRDIVEALGGLPMAIVLWAKNLKRKKEIESWRGIRNYLQDCPSEKKVEDAFKASYDSLDKRTKEIFLDIASFFIGNDQKIPCYMWEACGFHPPREVEDLCDMHLLEIGKHNELRMHNLLRHFGRELVKDKGQLQRCRFWNPRESLPTPNNVEGTLSVKGIGLTVEMGCTDSFNCKEFCKMSNLWYLRLDRAKIQGNTKDLPPNLRWLDWRGCRSIPELCDLHLKELVILDLSESKVTKNSEFWEQIAKKVEKLKVLNLQGCVKLHASFKFPAPTNLEILILEDCTELSEIGPFIKKLKKLSSLNLRNCRLVKQLPQELHGMENLTELLIDGTGIHQIVCQEGSLKSLKILSARGCKNLRFISTIGCLTELQSLALDGAKFNWHPKFVFPQNLQSLSLRNCPMFKELPTSIGKLGLLETMDLSDTRITELPESVKELSNLKRLKMEHTHLQKFPEDIVKLKKLEEIDFCRCRSLEGQVRCDISGLSALRILRLSSSSVAGLPQGICHLSRLQTLDVRKCRQLQALPELPSSLVTLFWGSKIMAVPKLTNLTNLKELCLNHDEQIEAGSSNQTPNMRWIMVLTRLETLELSLPNVTNLPGDFRGLTNLRELTLSYMKELDLTQLPSSNLWTLRLKHCKIPELKFSSLKHLSELELEDCDLAQIDGLKDLKLLELLKVFRCNRITDLDELKGLPRLRKVKVFPFDAASLSELRERGCEVDTFIPPSSRSVAG